jgi:LytR cell envelope-related transcriptional attenuator
MGAIPFAISVHHFVSTVGDYAGVASIIGLALLVLLFFSQARETANLRDRAEESDEHIRQLETQLAYASRNVSQPTPAPAPAPAGVHRRAPAPAPATIGAATAGAAVASRAAGPPLPAIPAAPAGVGAPALSSATRLIPAGGEDAISIRATGAGAVAGTAAGTAAAAEGSDAGAGVVAPPEPPPSPPPSTAAGGANGGGSSRAAAGAAAATAGAAAAGGAAGSGKPPRQPAPPRPAGARSPQSGRRPAPEPQRPSRARGAALIAVGVLAVAGIVVALLVLTSGGTSSSQSSSASQLSNAPTGKHHRSAHGAAVKPSAVMVDVLNGTATANLAHDITEKLAGHGYKTGTPATATDQTQTATTVGYLHGHRAAALLVANSLDLGKASVQPVAAANEAVACPQTSSCTAQVIVTVGADLASSAATTTSAATT